jgi:hypothetical protein
VAQPNPGSLQFKLLRTLWVHLDAPRHVQLIPPRLLLAKARDLGLKRELLTFTDPGSRGWNTWGWAMNLGNRFTGRIPSFAARMVGRGVGLLLSPLELRGSAGTCYTTVLRRPT